MKQFPLACNASLLRHRPRACRFAAVLMFTAATAFSGLPAACYAQNMQVQSGNNNGGGVTPVAMLSLTPLPDTTIAAVTGTGLKPPSIGNNAGSGPIILWDELRPKLLPPLTSSTSTITVNGVIQ